MKGITYMATAITIVMTLTGCNEWLDVPVEGKSTSKELFEKGDGYRSVLHGLYINMAEDVLYGKNLQCGLVDFFSNQYNVNVRHEDLSSTALIAAGKRDYQNKDLRPEIDKMWMAAYKCIGAANDLIQNVGGENAGKFAQGEMEKSLILGEAKAVRAYVHLDMLRLFAPAPKDDDGGVYVPYITHFPNTLAQHMKTSEVLDAVIKDLEEARELVKPYDLSTRGNEANTSGRARFYSEFEYGTGIYANRQDLDEFFVGRGYRFSYWAITATLARAYQYKGAYDDTFYDKAKQCAEEIINSEVTVEDKKKYYPFKEERFDGFFYAERPEDARDVRMVDNLIMGVYRDNVRLGLISNMLAQYPRKKAVVAQDQLFIVNTEGQDIFKTVDNIDESARDIRCTRLLYVPDGAYKTNLSVKWYVKENDLVERDKTLSIFPLLRTSEMRYIIAETEARKSNFAAAYKIINDMREHRGLGTSPLAVKSTFGDFQKDLVREAQREWISEGQLFYLYKRLGADVKRDDKSVKPFSKAEAVLPLPTDENL